MRATNAIAFRYRDKAGPYEMAPYLAEGLLRYPPEHVVSHGWLLDDLRYTGTLHSRI